MSLLNVQAVEMAYRNKEVLSGVSLTVERRERVALIGNNGSGKTTLLKIAMGKETPDGGTVTFARGIKVGYLSQVTDELVHGHTQAGFYQKIDELEFKLRTIEAEMSQLTGDEEAFEVTKLTSAYTKALDEFNAIGGYEVYHEITKTLKGLGLSDDALTTDLEHLSGGEKMRVALAHLLIEKPDLLILDEPTNHLDVHAIEWLENFLMKFSGGVLVVSHDRYFLDRVATRIAELAGGTLLEMKCNYSEFLDQKKTLREYYNKERKNLKIQIRDLKAMILELRRKRKSKQADSRQKEVDRLEAKFIELTKQSKSHGNLTKVKRPKIDVKAHGHVSQSVVQVEGLSKRFGQRRLFDNITFDIYGGEKVAIVGSNGTGKTTLLNLLRGIDDQYSGTAKLGAWINYVYLGQHVSFTSEDWSVLSEMMHACKLDEQEARRKLAAVELYGDEVNTLICDLSGGERVRLFFAIAMTSHPHCLILDEPTNHLDLSSREALEAMINAFNGTVIAVSHDRYYLNNCVSKVIELKEGKAHVFLGHYDEYIKSQLQEPVKVQRINNKPAKESPNRLEEIASKRATLEGRIEALEASIRSHEALSLTSPDEVDYKQWSHESATLESLMEEYVVLDLEA